MGGIYVRNLSLLEQPLKSAGADVKRRVLDPVLTTCSKGVKYAEAGTGLTSETIAGVTIGTVSALGAGVVDMSLVATLLSSAVAVRVGTILRMVYDDR